MSAAKISALFVLLTLLVGSAITVSAQDTTYGVEVVVVGTSTATATPTITPTADRFQLTATAIIDEATRRASVPSLFLTATVNADRATPAMVATLPATLPVTSEAPLLEVLEVGWNPPQTAIEMYVHAQEGVNALQILLIDSRTGQGVGSGLYLVPIVNGVAEIPISYFDLSRPAGNTGLFRLSITPWDIVANQAVDSTPIVLDFDRGDITSPVSLHIEHTSGTRDARIVLDSVSPVFAQVRVSITGKDLSWNSTINPALPGATSELITGLYPGRSYNVYFTGMDADGNVLVNQQITAYFTYNAPLPDTLVAILVNPIFLIGLAVVVVVVLAIYFLLRRYQRSWRLYTRKTAPWAILRWHRHSVIRRQEKRFGAMNLAAFWDATNGVGNLEFAREGENNPGLRQRMAVGLSAQKDRHVVNTYAAILKDIEAGADNRRQRNAISRYNQMLFQASAAQLYKDVSELTKAYWQIEDILNSFSVTLPDEPDSDVEIPEVVLEIILALGVAITSLSAKFNRAMGMPWQSGQLLDALSPSDRDSLQLIEDTNSWAIKQARVNIVTGIDDYLRELEARQSLITAAMNRPAEQQAINRENNGVIKHRDGMRAILESIAAALDFALVLLKRRLEHVEETITQILQNITTVEAMARVDESLNAITGSGFSQLAEDTIRNLLDIRQEVSAALAQQPESYGRRLAMLDAYLLIQQFQGQLKGSTLPRAKEWAAMVATIAELFKERRQVEESQGMAYINPYVTGNPIKANRLMLFKGRQHIAQEIITRLRGSGNPTLLLYGPRRMGKSSFLLHLPNLLPARYIPVYFDAQGAGATQSEANFCYLLARAIFDVMRKGVESRRSMTPLQAAPSLADFKENAFTRLEDWLSDSIAPVLENRTLLITIDEFEKIGEAIREGKMTTALLDQIRHMIQHRDELVFMFTGVQSLDVLVPDAASYFISVVSIELGYLDHDAAEDLIRNPASEQEGRVPGYDDAAVAEILRLSNCQPFLVQAICSEIITIANNEQLSLIQVEHVQRAAQIAQTRQTNFFRNIWDEAGEDGKAFLRGLVKNHAESDPSPAVIDDLLHRRIIRRVNGSFEVEVPLVREWIVKQG